MIVPLWFLIFVVIAILTSLIFGFILGVVIQIISCEKCTQLTIQKHQKREGKML